MAKKDASPKSEGTSKPTGQTYTRTVKLSQNTDTRRRQIKNGGY